MSEKALRRRVVTALKKLDAVSVENSVYPGTPDVNYMEGWIELKKISKWPKRVTTIIRINHFTPQQKVWLRRRWEAGGQVYLLLQVGQEFLLFPGDKAALLLGNVPRKQLCEGACQTWYGKAMDKEIAECLSKRRS